MQNLTAWVIIKLWEESNPLPPKQMKPLKIIDYRDPDGRFAKKNRQKGNVRIVLLLIAIAVIGILGYKSHWSNIEPWNLTAQTESSNKNDDGLTAEQKANLEKQYELAKQETVLKNKKDKLDADYKAQSDSIEAQIENIRAQKTSFQ